LSTHPCNAAVTLVSEIDTKFGFAKTKYFLRN
jgi:hypothetical protein